MFTHICECWVHIRMSEKILRLNHLIIHVSESPFSWSFIWRKKLITYDVILFFRSRLPFIYYHSSAFNKDWTLLKSLSLSLLTVQIPGDFQPLEDSLFSAPSKCLQQYLAHRYWINTCWVNAHLAPGMLELEVLEVGDHSKEADKNMRIRAFASCPSRATGVRRNGPSVSLYHVSLSHFLCTSLLSTLYLMKIIKIIVLGRWEWLESG